MSAPVSSAPPPSSPSTTAAATGRPLTRAQTVSFAAPSQLIHNPYAKHYLRAAQRRRCLNSPPRSPLKRCKPSRPARSDAAETAAHLRFDEGGNDATGGTRFDDAWRYALFSLEDEATGDGEDVDIDDASEDVDIDDASDDDDDEDADVNDATDDGGDVVDVGDASDDPGNDEDAGDEGDDAAAIPTTPVVGIASIQGDDESDPETNPPGAYTPHYEDIPDDIRQIILDSVKDEWSISNAREFQGRDFRPEFEQVVKTFKSLHDMMPTKCPRIAMSATFRKRDQDRINSLYGDKPDFILWTDMCKRRIFFEVVVSGNPAQSCATCIKQDLALNKDNKIIWYTNSKRKAEESLVPSAENVMDSLGIDGEAMACTGGAALAEKVFMLAAFKGDKELFSRPERAELADADIDDEMCEPPDLKILPATAAANCGISSDGCTRSYRVGPPPNLYDLIQEMGRVDRDRSLPPGFNRYEIHIAWISFVSLYVRIMQHPKADVRKRQLLAAYECLQFCLTPTQCFHKSMEAYFEHDTSPSGKTSCKKYCSFCTGGHGHLTGVFRKQELIAALYGKCFASKLPKYDEFIKQIKKSKNEIFEPNDVPNKLMGPIHALCLQLLAKGIVDLGVSDEGKAFIGTDKLEAKHIVVKGGVTKTGQPAFMDDDNWTGLTLVEKATSTTSQSNKKRKRVSGKKN
ncbi:hypothetical protein ACHAWF_015173 [Thalassiosira exigua]